MDWLRMWLAKKIQKPVCKKAKVPAGMRVFSFEMKYILLYRLVDL